MHCKVKETRLYISNNNNNLKIIIMKNYRVTYKKNNNVVNKEFTKKREANKYYIDMFLDGAQNLTFEEVKNTEKKKILVFFSSVNMSCNGVMLKIWNVSVGLQYTMNKLRLHAKI